MIAQTRADEFTPQSPWLDLVNSEQWDGFGHLTDHLHERKWISKFLRRWNLAPGRHNRAAPTELAPLRILLRRTSERISRGKAINYADLAALNTFLKSPSYFQVVSRHRELTTEPRPVKSDWSWVRAQLVSSFLGPLLEQPQRIKICANSGCRWVFIDATKSNIRRWCKDARCGNRDRVRRLRARQFR